MNALVSYHYIVEDGWDDRWVTRLAEAGGRVMVDSGAYSQFYADDDEVDEDERDRYFESYVEWVLEHESSLEAYFNLDAIGDPYQSMRYEERMRDAGLDPIPVWHGGCRDLADDDRFCEWIAGESYVAVGSSSSSDADVDATSNYDLKRLVSFMRAVNDVSPDTRVHLLGESRVARLRKLAPYSADSAQFVSYYRFPENDVRIYDRRSNRWLKLPKDESEWDPADRAYRVFLDIFGAHDLDDLKQRLDRCERYTVRSRLAGVYGGHYAWNEALVENDLTRVYPCLDSRHSLGCLATVGAIVGWLDDGYLEWVNNSKQAESK